MKFAAIALAGLLFCMQTALAADAPKTLFEMAGVELEAAKLSNSVLVIIDAQREYVDGALPLSGVNEAIAETAQLLKRARKSGTPVIHIVHKGRAGGLFNPEGKYFEIVPALHPQDGEQVIEKTRVSAFADTRLEEAIQRTGRKNLIIVGFMTHNCVSSTARTARDLGYAPTIVAAATATRNLPDAKGNTIPAVVVQAASLAELADRTATVVSVERAILE
ncbi:isochorismatase [Ferrigenium kumadai]|uniref:Isochorismatase n=1 Tax=Ferrigenium kumadai TaxID=1682490 RepID=A0AAN1SZH9_9PROT|nr:cysteine hydrolase family protein [Ferrigenium kumadai]BBI99942.1 isochorismatase [Ferrigenium kumadai]